MSDRTDHTTAPPPCGRRFHEELLSGYLDGALTQGDTQRVRLHLEDCPDCRARFQEMTDLREATMTTRFALPADDQWDETPRGVVSLWSRRLGWALVVTWAVGLACFLLWQIAAGPESLLEKTLVFGGILGVALLFISVLSDRLRAIPTDRYTNVHK